MDVLQLYDLSQHKGGKRFSWENQQPRQERWLATLDHIYTPKNKGGDFTPSSYTMHGNSFGLDHSPIKLELSIGKEERIPIVFKWNASYLKDSNLILKIKAKWLPLHHNTSFLVNQGIFQDFIDGLVKKGQ